MNKKIEALVDYLANNGTLEDAVMFTKAVASGSWGLIAQIYQTFMG